MSKIWFTSDTHYHHKNICKGTTSWNFFQENSSHQSTRNFDTLEEMNKSLVNGINKYVDEDDTLYHLGDFSFGGIENIWNFRKQINCKNIHLILGNHDHHIEKDKVLPNCHRNDDDIVSDGILKQDLNQGLYVYARKLFSSVQHVKSITVNKQRIFMSHYSHQVWDQSHHGVIHLFGHSHDTLLGIGKSMDVGIDCAYRIFGEYRPFSFEEIISIMDNKQISIIDHHNQNTN